jgi:hypothetical protein
VEETGGHKLMRNKFVRKAPASVKYSVITLLCRTAIAVGIAVTELGSLNLMGYLDPWVAGGK